MSFRSRPSIQNIATNIIATIIGIICAIIFPLPQNPIVRICILICILISLIWSIFSIQLPYMVINNKGIRFTLSVILPTISIIVILLSISYLNPNLKTFLTSDVVYSFSIVVFIVLFIRETIPSLRIREATALAATCIPIMYDEGSHLYRVTLVCNPNYKNEQWMFPGGHVHFSEGNYPPSVARSKALSEAGLEVELLCFTEPGKRTFLGIEHIVSPYFNYVFSLDDSARCKRAEGHDYHYDFTYIGRVTKTHNGNPASEIIILEFNNSNPTEADIQQELLIKLNSFYESKHELVPPHPFPPSIPIMLAKALPMFSYKEKSNA